MLALSSPPGGRNAVEASAEGAQQDRYRFTFIRENGVTVMRRESARGFTLIELLVVIAII